MLIQCNFEIWIFVNINIFNIIKIFVINILRNGVCHGADQVAAWLPEAATVNNLSSSALQALHFVF
jgi:hypothetical protein